MKKVLFVIPTLRVGGAEKSLVTLLGAMDPAHCQVELLLFEAGGPLQQEVPDWVRIREADPVTRAMTLEMRFYLKGLLQSGKFGPALSRMYISAASAFQRKTGRRPLFSWGVVEKHIPRVEGRYDVAVGYLEGFADFFVLDKVDAKRKIGWVHTDVTSRAMPREELAMYGRFDAMGTMSELCRQAFCKRVPACGDKLHVIENIVLPEQVRRKARQPMEESWQPGKIHLVSVGRLEHSKGYDLAVDACRILLDGGWDICWHVYGAGSLREALEQEIVQKGLQGSFLLEGQCANPYPRMLRADILVQPSRLEGKSIVLDEAKLLGKAIVVTDYPSVADQVTQEQTALVVEQTPQAIAGAVERLLQDPRLREKLERNCLREENQSIRALQKVYRLLEE